MATKGEINAELKIALQEIGKIVPWYDKRFKEWIFSSPLYPVECSGKSPEETSLRYTKYLREFITHRVNGTLAGFMERETKGRGGLREGAGRPKGTVKEPKARIYLPLDIVNWLKDKSHQLQVRQFMTVSEE